MKCCFIGHRELDITDKLKQKIKEIIEDLIIKHDVSIFLFGSRSSFNNLCHSIITELKKKYPSIIRKCYTCRNETCILESEREYLEKIYSRLKKDKVSLLGFEEEVEHKTKYTSGRANYVERNQAMINDSDYCIFYYNKNHKTKTKKFSSMIYHQRKSGTELAFNYAKQKKKQIINICDNQQ